MGFLRRLLDKQGKVFEKGGALHKLYPLWEAMDSFMYTPGQVTPRASHVRDGLDLKRMMTAVIIGLAGCIYMAMYNTGYQAHLAIEAGAAPLANWQTRAMEVLGLPFASGDWLACMVHGLLYYLPVLAVAAIVGLFWEQLFATLRRRERAPGLFVIALLFSLSLPPTIPLWQVALGMSFGIVVAKEVFGGTGKNFLNPALAALAFLYATYPKQMVGETAWTVVEGFTGATTMRIVAGGGIEGVHWAGTNWMQSFLGVVPGAFGATSTLACLLGAAVLIVTRVASLRIMAGALVGMVVAAVLFNQLVGRALPLGDLSWHWHLTLGSFVFGGARVAGLGGGPHLAG